MIPWAERSRLLNNPRKTRPCLDLGGLLGSFILVYYQGG
jgi:hypothetical protein